MANPKIKFKRSAVASKRPSLSNLELGELALNTYDGKLFTVQDTGGVGIATTVTLINPWNETYGENKISYGGTVTTGDINVNDLDGQNIFITGVTTSIGGFILKNPNSNNYSRNQRPPDYSDNNGAPTMDENPIAAGIYADGSASFSGIVTAIDGFVGNLTGDVTGNLTGTASNSNTVGGVTSSFLLDYTNLTNTPTIPTNNNELTNGAGYITTSSNITGNAATATYAINAGFSTNAGYAHTAGISTTSEFATNSSYAHVAGIATYATTAGVATNAQGLTGIPNISVSNLTAQQADINGITTFHSKVQLLDNRVLNFGGPEGSDGDLQIYHDTQNSYIKDVGVGVLKILGSNATFKNAADTKTSATFNADGAVDLYHNNTVRFETTSTGSVITGILTATSTINANGTGNSLLVSDTLRIAQTGSGLRMTNVGAFDNDGSDNFRIFSTNDLTLSANGDSGGGLSIDKANQNVTIDNKLIVGIVSVSSGIITASSGIVTYYGDGSGLINVGVNTANVSTNTLVVSGVSTFNGDINANNISVGGTLSLGGSGSQFFAYNEDTVKVKFANWYSSNDRQYGMGQLWFETWFGAIDNQAGRANRRIGFYLDEPNAGSTDSGTPGQHPTNDRAHIDINGFYVENNLEVNENLLVVGIATFQGNVSIAGTLTYEDVENIDSVGLITARSGVRITGGGLDVVGVSTFNNDIYVDQIRRKTDNSTNTKIQLNAGQMKLFAGNGTTAKISLNGTVAITTNTTVSGILTATSFSGDGSTLSNIPTSIIAGDNISVSGSTGTVTITGLANTTNVSADTLVVSGISTLGVVTGATYYGDGSNLTGVANTANVISNTLQSGIITATEQFYPPSLTTVERDGLSFNAGAFIFNETENKLQMYLGGQWKNLAFELDSYSVVGL